MSDAGGRDAMIFLRALSRDAVVGGVVAAALLPSVLAGMVRIHAVAIVATVGVWILLLVLLGVSVRHLFAVRAGGTRPGVGAVFAMAFVFAKPFLILGAFAFLIQKFDPASVAVGLVLSVITACIRALLHSTRSVQSEYTGPPTEPPSASMEP